jgi:hypothetical protein
VDSFYVLKQALVQQKRTFAPPLSGILLFLKICQVGQEKFFKHVSNSRYAIIIFITAI